MQDILGEMREVGEGCHVGEHTVVSMVAAESSSSSSNAVRFKWSMLQSSSQPSEARVLVRSSILQNVKPRHVSDIKVVH